MVKKLAFCRISARIQANKNCLIIMITQIRKKAQEVSFVLLKIAGYIRHKELAARLESISYQLIEALYSDDLNTAMAKVEAAIGLSSLASNVGEMSANNTAIVLKELENLKAGILQYKETREVREMPSMEGLFSKLTIAPPSKQVKPQVAHSQKPAIPARQSQDGLGIARPSQSATVSVSTVQAKPVSVSQPISENNGAAIIRQNSILATIKLASGKKLQLKDLIAAFPDISERTLRYDLVKLCQIGKLRREGMGGPSNFYVATGDIAASGMLDRPADTSLGGVMNS